MTIVEITPNIVDVTVEIVVQAVVTIVTMMLTIVIMTVEIVTNVVIIVVITVTIAVHIVCATVTKTFHWNCAIATIALHILDKKVPNPLTTEITALTIAFQIELAIPINAPNIVLKKLTAFCQVCCKYLLQISHIA